LMVSASPEGGGGGSFQPTEVSWTDFYRSLEVSWIDSLSQTDTGGYLIAIPSYCCPRL